MTAADNKIVKENPNQTPYQLLQLGLSQKGYAEMQGLKSSIEPIQTVQPTKVTPAIIHSSMQPNLRPVASASDMVRLYNVKSQKTGHYMTRATAEGMVKKYPSEYEILA